MLLKITVLSKSCNKNFRTCEINGAKDTILKNFIGQDPSNSSGPVLSGKKCTSTTINIALNLKKTIGLLVKVGNRRATVSELL